MKKSLKAMLALTFCIVMVVSTMLVASAVGNISNLKATNVTLTSATISWSAASGADGYELSYTTGSTTKTVTIKGKSTTSYKLTLSPDKSYTVQVRSYDKKLAKTDYGSWYKITVKTIPATVTNIKATNLAGGKSVKLTWTKVANATGYVIQYYKGSKWTTLKTVTGTSYTVSGLTTGTTYKFRIAAYQKYSGKNYYGSYATLSAKPTLLAPEKFVVSAVSESAVKVSCTAVSGARGYQFYNVTTGKSGTLAARSATFKGLKAGTTYLFKVRACTKVNGKLVYGEWSPVIEAVTTPAKVTNLKVSGVSQTGAKVTFDKAQGALGYQIYLYDYATGSQPRVANQLTTGAFDLTGLKAGSTYRVGVRSYVKNDTKYYFSALAYFYFDTAPVTATGEGTNATDIVLEWSPVRKATRYTVERYAANKASWTAITEIPAETVYTGTVTSEERISYTDAGVGENKGELYRITAYNGESVINSVEFNANTTGITLSQNDYSVTVTWDAPANTTKYTVFKMPINAGQSYNLFSYDFDIEDPATESYTFNLAPNEMHSYMIFATRENESGIAVATFNVKSGKLIIDSSAESKTAQILMLVNAINKAKLYQGDVTVTADTYAKMTLDAIYFSQAMLDQIPGAGLITDNGEIAGDDVVGFFELLVKLGLAEEGDIPETVTIEDPDPVTHKFSEGYAKNAEGYTMSLKNYIEPSGTANKLAYLYDQHDAAAIANGFSSIKTTYYPETGKYKVVATLKEERFGTSTSQKEAHYHPGFVSVYDALGFSGEDVNNELTTLGATTITAYIDAEGRIYSYKVTSPFSTKFMASGSSDESIGMKMSGTTTLSYTLAY